MKTKTWIFVAGIALAAVLTFSASGGAPGLPPAEADSAARLTASPRHGEWVKVPVTGGAPVDTWVVYPERSGPAPVVLVVHEIFGLTPWARAVADQLAAEGFLAVAPDFLTGKAPDGVGGSVALGPEASRGAIAQLDPKEILARLNAAAAWGTSQPSATKAYGVVGFCWGGGIAYSYAAAQPGLAAAVGYYGTAPAAALGGVRAPVLALYGGSDARVTSTLAGFQDEMKRLGKAFETEVYEGAGHAFLRQQGGQNGANLAASQKAWPRTVAFLKAQLEGKKTVQGLPAVDTLAESECAEPCVPPDLTSLTMK